MLRHSLIRIACAAALAGSTACVGSLDTQAPGGDDDSVAGGPDGGGVPASLARQTFETQVEPILLASCSTCHADNNAIDGPDYLGTGPDTYYDSLTSDMRLIGSSPSNSMLLLKGEHTGPAFTSAQATVVAGWIQQEIQERGITPPSETPPPADAPPTTLTAALRRFGDCMSIDDWDATNMQNVANQNTEDGPCYACHSSGTAGSFLSQNSQDMFDMNRQTPYILKLALGTVNSDGSFKDLVPARRFMDKGQEEGLHPSYLLSAERTQSVTDFYNLTYQHYLAGNCTPAPPL